LRHGLPADADRIRELMRALGRAADADARVYVAGGATAVLMGWRPTTIDVDLKIVPEHDAILRAIQALKDGLQINVELASPLDFIPVRPGWEDRSPFVEREGRIDFHHFDLVAQALAKVERGHAQDLADVEAMLARGLVTPEGALHAFESIAPSLYRYPAIDARSFRLAVDHAFRR
jgi:hypothetical protein